MSYLALKKVVEQFGNNEVARRIGKSPATISRIIKGDYPNPERILVLVAETFPQSDTLTCPVLGVISVAVCHKFRGWSAESKIHRDPNYRRVKSTCLTCKE